MGTQREDWIGALDGVRGLAALSVLVAHVLQFLGWRNGVVDAAVAVDVFMVVSGFLMLHHYSRRRDREPWESPRTWGTFWVRRFFRIAPLHYAVLLVAYLGWDSIAHWWRSVDFVPAVRAGHLAEPTAARAIGHITYLFGICPTWKATVPIPDWSVGLEMQFYSAFPLLVILIHRLPYLLSGVLAVAIVFAAKPFWPYQMPSLLLLKLPVFLSGMFLAIAYEARASRSYPMLAAVCLACFGSPLLPLFVALIALAILDGSAGFPARLRSALSCRFATWLADMSYAVYLGHVMVFFAVAHYLTRYDWFLNGRVRTRVIVVLPIVIVASYVLAAVAHRFIERPGISLGKWLIGRTRAQQQKPLTAVTQP